MDTSGNAYVTGEIQSGNFPTTAGAFQAVFGGGFNDAFVTKVNADGSALIYSTYLGGYTLPSDFGESGDAIAVDSSGNAYVTGYTNSTDFPTKNPFQATKGDFIDAFVTKFDSTGSVLVYSTYLGGVSGSAIAVDSAGNAYVTGVTGSTDFPVTDGAFQTVAGDTCCTDAFVTKLSPAGSALVYSTYLGGSVYDYGRGIAVDAFSNAYVTGGTSSTDFPTTPGAFQTTGSGFVTKLNAEGSALLYSTYFATGGSAIAVDSFGNAYVTGTTTLTDFPTTTGAFQTTYGGGYADAFVAKIADTAAAEADLTLTKTDNPDPVTVGNNLTYTVTVTNNGPDAATGVVVTDTTPAGVTFVSSSPSQGTCSGTSTVSCNLGTLAKGATATVTIIVTPTAAGGISNTATVAGNNDPNPGNNTDTEVTTVNPPATADLIISALSAPLKSRAGATITVTDTTKNQGTGSASASTTKIYLSTNTTLGTGDVLLGSRAVPALAPGAINSGSKSVTIPPGTPTGTRYLIAKADANNNVPETREGNNTRATAIITINP